MTAPVAADSDGRLFNGLTLQQFVALRAKRLLEVEKATPEQAIYAVAFEVMVLTQQYCEAQRNA